VRGRLNVSLYSTFHFVYAGRQGWDVRTLAAGLRFFATHLSTVGSLFATLIAKDLLVNHLRALSVRTNPSGALSGKLIARVAGSLLHDWGEARVGDGGKFLTGMTSQSFGKDQTRPQL